MTFESKDPQMREAKEVFDAALAELPLGLRGKLCTMIDDACKPAVFRMTQMNRDHQEIGRVIAVGIVLRLQLLIEEYAEGENE